MPIACHPASIQIPPAPVPPPLPLLLALARAWLRSDLLNLLLWRLAQQLLLAWLAQDPQETP